MAKLDIGGQVVEVGDEFLKLSPADQQAAVEEIAASLKGGAPAAEPKGDAPSGLESFARGAKQGATLNFGDELSGVAAASPVQVPGFVPKMMSVPAELGLGAARLLAEKVAPGTFGSDGGKAYDETVAHERAADAAAQEANPVTYFAGEVGGALASAPVTPMLAPFRAAQGANIAARGAAAAGNLAATGAAYGAASGIGAGEGGIAERLLSGAAGAGTGLVLGPVVGGAFTGVAKASGFVADHIAASRNPQKPADRVVARGLERDGADAGELAQRIADDQAQAPGVVQNLTVADLAGPNTKGAAGNAVRQPGPARAEGAKFLNERQEGSPDTFSQADRITAQLSNLSGPDGSLATADRILAERSAKGRELYDAPMKAAIDYDSPEGKRLLALFDRIPGEAKASAQKIMAMAEREADEARPAAAGSRAVPVDPGSVGPKPDSLARFIARNGGLSLEGGDAVAAGLDRVNIRGVGKLARENGKSIDGYWRDVLIENGYLPRDPDGGQARDITGELYNLLERDLSGQKVFPEGYREKGRVRPTREERDEKDALRAEVLRDLLSRGRDPRTVDPDTLDRAAERLAARMASDGASAYEMAASQGTLPAQGRGLTAQHWDYLKQGLDKLVTDNTDAFGRVNALGNAGNQLRRAVVEATERAVPGLGEARKVWRGHTEELNALRAGEKAFGSAKTVEQVYRDMADLSETGQELYRLGAINALKEQLGSRRDGNNKAALVDGSPNLREKLKAILPDRESYVALSRYLANERAMFETRSKALGNSATAERLADALDAERPEQVLEAIEAMKKLGTGNVLGALAAALRYVNRISPEMRGAVLEEVRKVVLNPSPEAVRAFKARLDAQAALPAPMREAIGKLVVQALPRAITNQATEQRSGREARR